MLNYAVIFFIIAIIAAALGISGVAALATQCAVVLFIVSLVLFLIHWLKGRPPL